MSTPDPKPMPAPAGPAMPSTPSLTARAADAARKVLPADPKRRRLVIGGAVLAACLALGCCGLSGGGLAILAVSRGWFSDDKTRAQKKLLGNWEGDTKYILVFTTTFEFKANGVVNWTQNDKGAGLLNNRGSGTWKVDRVDGDRCIVHMINDQDPDKTHGWTITFKGDDQFTIEGFDDIAITVKRKP